jgi:hypothetical protein
VTLTSNEPKPIPHPLYLGFKHWLEIWFNLPIHEWDYKSICSIENLQIQKHLEEFSTKIR